MVSLSNIAYIHYKSKVDIIYIYSSLIALTTYFLFPCRKSSLQLFYEHSSRIKLIHPTFDLDLKIAILA